MKILSKYEDQWSQLINKEKSVGLGGLVERCQEDSFQLRIWGVLSPTLRREKVIIMNSLRKLKTRFKLEKERCFILVVRPL